MTEKIVKGKQDAVSKQKLLEWLERKKRRYANMVPNEMHNGSHMFCHICTKVNVLKDLIKEARRL